MIRCRRYLLYNISAFAVLKMVFQRISNFIDYSDVNENHYK